MSILLVSLSISVFNLLVSYPFDVAYTQMAGDMTGYGLRRIYPTIRSTIRYNYTEIGYKALYSGAFPAFVSNLFQNYFRLFLFNSVLFKNRDSFNNAFFKQILEVSLATWVMSVAIYPLDTAKKLLQTSGRLGYYARYSTTREVFNKLEMKSLYNGFLVHSLKIVPANCVRFVFLCSVVV